MMMGLKQIIIVALLAVLAVQVSSKDVKTLYTLGNYYSQYFPLESNLEEEKTLRFSVRVQSDAYILLAPSHQADGPVYEIVLGAHDNTINYIRGRCPCQEEPSATVRTVNLLNGKEFVNFWIRIKADGRRTFIQVGLGDKDIPFNEWRDPRPLNPQYLSFRSKTAAEWRYGYSDEAYTDGVSEDKRQSVVTSTGYGQYFPLSEVASHSDDAVTLYFTVRSSKEFQILLSPSVSPLGDVYEFGISEKSVYIRRQHLGNSKAVREQEGYLNEQERLKYWISIHKDGRVMLGRGGTTKPLLQWRDPRPISPQFVSFTLYRARGDEPDSSSYADVQYGLGPDYTIATQDCTPRWKQGSSQLPPGAVRGGRNVQNELYVCRANHNGNDIPGSAVLRRNRGAICELSSDLGVYEKTEFQVLTGCRFGWSPASLGIIPNGAISAGETTQNVKLYVSRVAHESQVIIGRLHPSQRLTYIAFDDQELPFTNYEVLVNLPPGQTSSGSRKPNNPSLLIGK